MAVNEMFRVTMKGGVIIPKGFRKNHRIEGRALLVDTKEGMLIKPAPDPLAEKGSRDSLQAGHPRNCSARPYPEQLRYKDQLLKVYMHTISLL